MAHRILIVDDNPINLKLAGDVLEMEGFEIQRAGDVAQALDMITHQLPDLILMDIELPGVDGLTFTQMLRQQETTKNLAIVALTAFAMKGDEHKALQAGCNAYLAKPIDIRKFPKQIADFLQQFVKG